jgi:hypothetical protein
VATAQRARKVPARLNQIKWLAIRGFGAENSGLWSESNWRLEHDALILPNGRRLTLAGIRQWQEDLYDGAADLTRHWNGWWIRQQFLIAPGGTTRRGYVTELYLRHAVQMADWHRNEISRRQLALF